MQFDGCRNEKYRVIRIELDIFNEKLKALEQLVETGCKVVLIPAVEPGVNEHEVGDIVPFGLGHPAVLSGIFSTGLSRWTAHAPRPLQRTTIPNVLRPTEAQTGSVPRAV